MKIFMLVLVASFAVFSCSSLTVKTDFDPEYDFNAFKTYRWASAKEMNPNDELAKHPLVQKRLMSSVDKAMSTKGFKMVESGEADVVVLIHAGSKERMQVHQTGGTGYYRGWYDPWWGPYGGSTHVSYYEEGTLVIDLVAWETKELAWRGMGTKTLKDYDSSEEQQAAYDEIVAKIMVDYPPKK